VGSTHVTGPELAGLESFHKEMGMRIDYVLASPTVMIQDEYVDREARKGKLPSDPPGDC
jgi:exonuclease III